jgi:S-adenosylmethionine hydrolase
MRIILGFLLLVLGLARAESPLVLQTDFGLKDGAVGAMKGVAVGVSPRLAIYDLSHENTPYDIWEAAYRLKQAAPFWPAGTVFVSVIDPGVGTARKSVVLQTKTGLYFVSPDNGTLTLVAEDLGIAAVREIDESKNRRPGSERSYTFHGRDVYVYVGARLASGVISYDEVGPLLPPRVVTLDYERARAEGGTLIGAIPALDYQFGNIWTNLDEPLFDRLAPKYGERFQVVLRRKGQEVYSGEIAYVRTFGDVPAGAPLLYINSLMNVSIALNQGDFAARYKIGSGAEWSVRVQRVQP